jgi:RimJ/RimL family protein N-acetyltransferase
VTGGLRTERLVLRGWRPDDLPAFAAMNADPEVMEHFPSPLSAARSDELAGAFQAHIEQAGWGAWAVERRDRGEFIGFVGLVPVSFEADFTPAVEVGWRLDRRHWGHGFAAEAALASLDFAFGTLGLERVVSFTAVTNLRSAAVMRRIGMRLVAEFTHPNVPSDSPLRRHVLYAVEAPGRT